MKKVRVDSSARTHLPLCDLCGWRGHITASRRRALTQAVTHERISHPGRRDAHWAYQHHKHHADTPTRRGRKLHHPVK